jgi:mannose-6-phosphate isomerase-like protein (cupin superfamily)
MDIIYPEQAEPIPYAMDARCMYAGKSAELIRLVIPPGCEQELHDNPVDVLFVILQGEGILLFEHESFSVTLNGCLEVRSGRKRAWKNSGNQDLVLLVYRMLLDA